jgi:diguanylate cyclase (GGDEF)-like protein
MGSEATLTRGQLQTETLLAGGVAVAFSAAALNHDWCERLCRWLMRYEAYQADELVLLALVFAGMSIVLLVRREKQLRSEIRSRHAAEQAAHWAARHDHLTSLPNRLAFAEQFGTGAAANSAVFLIDLDGFKSINDTRGHAAGDEVLKIVAARLQCVGTTNAAGLAARMGGDEFSWVVRPAPSDSELIAIGREIVRVISAPIMFGGLEFRVTASVGIARSDVVPVHHEELLHRADLAMYAAKQAGSGEVSLFGVGFSDPTSARPAAQAAASGRASSGPANDRSGPRSI